MNNLCSTETFLYLLLCRNFEAKIIIISVLIFWWSIRPCLHQEFLKSSNLRKFHSENYWKFLQNFSVEQICSTKIFQQKFQQFCFEISAKRKIQKILSEAYIICENVLIYSQGQTKTNFLDKSLKNNGSKADCKTSKIKTIV